MNGNQGQILAASQPEKCFKKGEELLLKIKNQTIIPIDYLESVGI